VSVEIIGSKGSRARPRIEVPPEVSIAFQVARELRFSSKFSDDGAPEGTLERPLAVHNPERKSAHHEEVEEALDIYQINE